MAGTTEKIFELSPYQSLITKLQRDLTLDEMKRVLHVLDVDRNQIKSLESCDFVDVLQTQGILREGNANRLYDALKRCRFDKVATHVKIYEDHLKQDDVADKKADERPALLDPTFASRIYCSLHPQYTVELFCNTCNVKICYQCVFEKHKDKTHHVLSGAHIHEQIEIATDLLKQRILSLKDMVLSVRKNIEEFEKSEAVGNFTLIEAQANLWLNLLKQHEQHMLKALAERKECMERKLGDMKIRAQESENSIRNIREAMSKSMKDMGKLQQLELLSRWKHRLTELKAKVNRSCYEEENVAFLFRPLSASGVFAELRFGNVVGAITLSKNYAMVVKDERNSGMKITAYCVSYGTQNTMWSRELEDFRCDKPVIIAANLFGTGIESSVMVAVGDHLTAIKIERHNEECSIANVISFDLKNGSEESYITAMTTITSGNRDVGMLIARNASTRLYRLNVKMKPDGDIDCSSAVHSIYSVACVDNDIAIVDSVREEVVLLTVRGDDIIITGKLQVTENSAKIPKMIQWDGNFWSVLLVSNEDMSSEITWETVNYLKDSNKYSSSGSGTCAPKTTAVSISFIRDLTSVCFSDGTVNVFSTVVR